MDRDNSVVYPKWDIVNMRPRAKMPNCPNCDEDAPYSLLRPAVRVTPDLTKPVQNPMKGMA